MKSKVRKDRDKERAVSTATFVKTLRRMADALEGGEAFVIQVKGERVRVPKAATLSIEHEREGGSEEIELQVKWERAAD